MRDRLGRSASAALGRALILTGWAFAIYVVWFGVPFVVLYALGQIEELGPATLGDIAQRVLGLVGFLALAGVPALLAWYLLVLSSGRPQAAAVLATLISLAYVATAPPRPRAPSFQGDLAGPLAELTDASYAFLSLVLSWLFSFATGAILLLAERPEEDAV